MTARATLIGLFVSLLVIRLFHLTGKPQSLQLFAVFLAYTSCVYAGTALASGKQPWLAIEGLFSLAILACAWLGLIGSPLWISLGYGLHGLWDLAHHPKAISTKVVRWFPPLCAVFDFVVAIYVLVVLGKG